MEVEKPIKESKKKNDEPRPVVKNASDLQRMKIEKLMKNPEKEIIIPERPKEKKLPPPPDFIRNVMGSSAGAGSGEFHVYRHLRRKEYARQKFIQEQKEKARLDDDFKNSLEYKQKELEEKLSKKRQKRAMKKSKYKEAKRKKKSQGKFADEKNNTNSSEDNSDGDEIDKVTNSASDLKATVADKGDSIENDNDRTEEEQNVIKEGNESSDSTV